MITFNSVIKVLVVTFILICLLWFVMERADNKPKYDIVFSDIIIFPERITDIEQDTIPITIVIDLKITNKHKYAVDINLGKHEMNYPYVFFDTKNKYYLKSFNEKIRLDAKDTWDRGLYILEPVDYLYGNRKDSTNLAQIKKMIRKNVKLYYSDVDNNIKDTLISINSVKK